MSFSYHSEFPNYSQCMGAFLSCRVVYVMSFEGGGIPHLHLHFVSLYASVSKQQALKINQNEPTHVTVDVMAMAKSTKMLNYPFSIFKAGVFDIVVQMETDIMID